MFLHILSRSIGGSILATAGWQLGEYISDTWGAELYVPWVFGLTAGGFALGLVATPFVSNRIVRLLVKRIESIPTSRLLSGITGLVVGLLVGVMFSIPLSRLPGWPGVGLPITVSAFLAYLGASIMASPGRDIFQNLIAFELPLTSRNGHASGNGVILVDTSAIIDGRVADISQTGFLRGTLVIPQFVLDELRHIADSSDSLRRSKGRRGLEILNKLSQETDVPLQIMDVEYDGSHEVDAKLVGVAKEMHASIMTTDYNLNRVASIQGVQVLNVNELANSLKPVVLPGDSMVVKVIQKGKEPGQGVAYLTDGTMVVVDAAAQYIDQDMDVQVTRVLQTAAGCIIFAQRKRE